MVKAHVVGEQEYRAVAKLLTLAAIVEGPGIRIPMVEMPVLDRNHFFVHMPSPAAY